MPAIILVDQPRIQSQPLLSMSQNLKPLFLIIPAHVILRQLHVLASLDMNCTSLTSHNALDLVGCFPSAESGN